jgi:hypothetical protein
MTMHHFDFGSGRIVHDGWCIVDERPLKEQLDDLREDLVQVDYEGVTLDIGWYPDGDPSGEFLIHVVRNGDWDHPLVRASARSVEELKAQLPEAVKIASAECAGRE